MLKSERVQTNGRFQRPNMSSVGSVDRTLCESINAYLEVGITISDIQTPKAELIQAIYKKFLMISMGVHEASLVQVPFDFSPTEPDVFDTHGRSFPILILFTTMKTFFSDFVDGFHFSMEDLLSPAKNVKRTRKILSVLVDYMRHYQTLDTIFSEAAGKYEEKREELNRAVQEIDMAEQKKEELMQKRNIRKREETALMEKFGEARKRFNQVMEENVALESSKEEYLTMIENNKLILDQLAEEQEGLRAQLDTLSMELISSPERVTKELCDFKADLKNLIISIEKQRRINKDTQQKIELAPSIAKMIESLQDDITRIDSLKLEIESGRLTRDEWQERMYSEERNIAGMNNHIENLKKKQKDAEQDLACQKDAHQTRMNELNLKYDDLHRDVTALRNERGRFTAEQANILKDIARSKKAGADLTSEQRFKLEQIATKSKSILQKYGEEVNVYNEQLALFKEHTGKIFNSTKANRYSNTTLDESLL